LQNLALQNRHPRRRPNPNPNPTNRRNSCL
jgi:hypothetical protein